ncbi:MAG: DNA polymerase III subunit gamma/tau [Firmicutes bacterium]|nr:DNA polymerase III subunit gamma/tau [Bacillota bacterium]
MSYRALYRTYRPIDFNEVAGQKHITTTLQNALKNGKVQHAYLFSGPRGTGKTSIAKIFAKAINCELAPVANPCNICENCKGIQDGSINDVIEIDAASNNGVDEIREIRDKVKYLPGYVKFKVYIIDEVHMLSTGAFNALLKTLEEPPAHVIFVLCTTEPQKIPLTIHSRCQRFDFKAITPSEIIGKLNEIIQKENIKIDSNAVEQIAIYAEGGLRDAIGLLDQVNSFSPEGIILDDVNQICGAVSFQKQIEIVDAIMEMNSTKAIEAMDQLIIEGKEIQKIALNLLEFFRDTLMLKNVGATENTSNLFKNEQFIQLSKTMSNRRIFFYIDILNKALSEIKWSNNPKLFLELAIIKMTDTEPTSDAKLMDAVEKLEHRMTDLETREPIILQPEILIEEEDPFESLDVKEETKDEEKEKTAESEPETIKIQKELCEDISNTYKIEFVEDVLNNGDREDKIHLINNWNLLTQNNPSGIHSQYASVFEGGTLVASSYDKIIVTYSSAGPCNRLMKPSVKKTVKEVLEKAFNRTLDYIALPEDVFQTISDEFALLWRQGKRHIKLSKIVCQDLRDVSIELAVEVETEKEKKVIADAIDLFGDIVTIKK